MEAIKNRYEFVVLFDVENGNPNGDPDAGNMPRTDPEKGLGIVTDVCLKRKIRNFVEIVKEGEPGYNILIKTDKSLNDKFAEAHEALGTKEKKKPTADDIAAARKFMCESYFDVRTFGAVMSTGDNPCGIVRGPVQMNFARSIDPILPSELTITRQAITDAKTFQERSDKNGVMTEMGKKYVVPYALYRAEGYVSAMLAQKQTGFSEEDLELLWTAIINMFEHDHSAARGKVCVRKLYVFKHESVLGNAPSVLLFEKIKVEKKEGVEYPRSISDYEISVDREMPAGVELIEKLA
ncbi:MAG: type I-C CRISPR-associated protein Cas7/Csd2 [Clostridia bacterium]|nr:type I-C CRISPR-associated protein Cas7/Csd2 [Clostridia bacterium]